MPNQRRRQRRTSSRVTGKKRKIQGSESDEILPASLTFGKDWFYQQSPNAQVYYLKVAFGVISGGIIGLFYVLDFIAKNWFLFPLLGVIGIGLLVRRFLDIDKDLISDFKLYAWNGTISLFIGFICSSALIYMIFNPITVIF